MLIKNTTWEDIIYSQYNKKYNYTKEQLEFYKKYPDVTRLIMYSIFEDLIRSYSKKNINVVDTCSGFGKDVANLAKMIFDKKVHIEARDISEQMIEDSKKEFNIDVKQKSYDDNNEEKKEIVLTRYGYCYSENPSVTFRSLKKMQSDYILCAINHPDVYKGHGKYKKNLSQLPLFDRKVEIVKPIHKLSTYYNAFKKNKLNILFEYHGKEHSLKFHSKSEKDYIVFLLSPKLISPVSMQTYNLVNNINKLENQMQLFPNKDYSDFVFEDTVEYYKVKNYLSPKSLLKKS